MIFPHRFHHKTKFEDLTAGLVIRKILLQYSPINNTPPPYNKTPRSIKDLKTQNNKTPCARSARKKFGLFGRYKGGNAPKRTILGVRNSQKSQKKTQNNKTPRSIRIQNLDFLTLRGGVIINRTVPTSRPTSQRNYRPKNPLSSRLWLLR